MFRGTVVLLCLSVLLLALATSPVILAQVKNRPSAPSPGMNGPSRSTGGSFPGGNPTESPTPLMVKVVLPNDRPVGENVEVELLAATGSIVSSYYTNSEGEVTFNSVGSGSYRLHVRGFGLVDTTTDNFYLEPSGGNRLQYVHVKPVESENAVGSTQPMVSASELSAPDKAKREFTKGTDAMVAGDMKKALDHFNRAVNIYPNYGIAYNNMGAAYVHEHDNEHARAAFEKAVEVDPQLASANANLARLRLIDNKPAQAIPLLDRALASEPKSADFLFLMCRAQLGAGNYDQAINYAHRVHEQEHRKYSAVHLIAGTAYESENKLADARTEYELFLQETPQAPQAAQVRAELNRLSAAASAAPVK